MEELITFDDFTYIQVQLALGNLQPEMYLCEFQ
jgi:hypothetical protein